MILLRQLVALLLQSGFYDVQLDHQLLLDVAHSRQIEATGRRADRCGGLVEGRAILRQHRIDLLDVLQAGADRVEIGRKVAVIGRAAGEWLGRVQDDLRLDDRMREYADDGRQHALALLAHLHLPDDLHEVLPLVREEYADDREIADEDARRRECPLCEAKGSSSFVRRDRMTTDRLPLPVLRRASARWMGAGGFRIPASSFVARRGG